MTGRQPAVEDGQIHGWRAIHLRSDVLAVTVLPDKGADIFALTDLASGIDPLLKPHGGSSRQERRLVQAAAAWHSWRITTAAGRSFSRIPTTRRVTEA